MYFAPLETLMRFKYKAEEDLVIGDNSWKDTVS